MYGTVRSCRNRARVDVRLLYNGPAVSFLRDISKMAAAMWIFASEREQFEGICACIILAGDRAT